MSRPSSKPSAGENTPRPTKAKKRTVSQKTRVVQKAQPGSIDGAVEALLTQVVGDRYLIVEQLGEDQEGVVYRAEHIALRMPLYVKVMHAALADDERAVEEFRREAIAVAQLRCDELCSVLDCGFLRDGRAFVAMELCEGETLAELLAGEPRLSPPCAIELLRQIAGGLVRAQTAGLRPIDVDPAGIVVTEKGIRLRGPLRRSPPSSANPEAYATAVLGYRMLAGSAPDPTRPAALRTFVSGIDPGVEDAIMWALTEGKNGLFTSVKTLLDALPTPEQLTERARPAPGSSEIFAVGVSHEIPPIPPPDPTPTERAWFDEGDWVEPPARPRRWRYLLGATLMAAAVTLSLWGASHKPPRPAQPQLTSPASEVERVALP